RLPGARPRSRYRERYSLGSPQRDACARADPLEHAGVADDPADDVHGAGGTDLVASAHGRGPEEDAEGAPGRPVAEVAGRDDVLRRLGADREADVKIDLVAPGLALGVDRKRTPDGARRLRLVELGFRRHLARRDHDRATRHHT